jgi:hypothetical protein
VNKDKYLLLKGKLPEELGHFTQIEKKLEELGLYPEVKTSVVKGLSLNDEIVSTYLGSLLHAYYDHTEKVFKLIAKNIDGCVPDGESWHKELLDQMAIAIPEKRPAVLNKPAQQLLEELRGFRHVYRNVYGDNLDPIRIENLVRKLPMIAKNLKEDLDSFIHTMDLLYSNHIIIK